MARYCILSIDGGGIRGIIPAVVIHEIEQRAKAKKGSQYRMSDLFDYIAGTSTGGIIACGLNVRKNEGSERPKYRAKEIIDFYHESGPCIFKKGASLAEVMEGLDQLSESGLKDILRVLVETFLKSWDGTFTFPTAEELIDQILKELKLDGPLHSVHNMARTLYEYMGESKMKDAITGLMVTAYDTQSRAPRILTDSDDGRVRLYQAATATAAAPGYFAPYALWQNPEWTCVPLVPEHDPFKLQELWMETGSGSPDILIDGGPGSGLANPAMQAYLQSGAHKMDDVLLVSLGCGKYERVLPSSETLEWGPLQWMMNDLFDVMFDGQEDTVDDQIRLMLKSKPNHNYYRFQQGLSKDLAVLDSGDPDTVIILEGEGKKMVEFYTHEIDEVVKLLCERTIGETKPGTREPRLS